MRGYLRLRIIIIRLYIEEGLFTFTGRIPFYPNLTVEEVWFNNDSI